MRSNDLIRVGILPHRGTELINEFNKHREPYELLLMVGENCLFKRTDRRIFKNIYSMINTIFKGD